MKAKKEISDKDKFEAPEPPATQINNSSTFWDWVQKDHPLLLKVLFAIGFLVILVVTYFITWIIPVFLLASLVLGHFIFKGAFFAKDSIIVVSTYDDKPSQMDVILIGKEKFRKLEKDGDAVPFSTTGGTPLYVADSITKSKIHFPWSFTTSRFRFILEREAFDKVKALAEDSTRQLHSIRHIPWILALTHSSKIIQKQEAFYTEVLEGDSAAKSMEDISDEALKELEQLEDSNYV